MDEKESLRREIRRRKRDAAYEELRRQSNDLTRRLLRHPRVRDARCLMLYASLPDEVDTVCLIRLLHGVGKRVLLPVVIGPGEMALRTYEGEDHTREGAFHILEPTGDDFTRYDAIDVAIIPGMAFDPAGNRLGRGKGYYDRFLPKVRLSYKIGVCYGFQMVERVPVGDLDQPMDEVVFSK